MKKKTIFLVDMNAFFASVHQAENPELRGKPVLVAGDREKRTGVVLAKSYECLDYAPVKTAMSLYEALKLLPEAVVVKPDHQLYAEYAKETRAVMSEFTPCVEPFSIDEAFMDMTGTEKLFGKPVQAAGRIQGKIKEKIGLPCSIGIGRTRIAAKMAAGFHKPMGVSTLWPSEIEKKLYPLEVDELYGIGKKAAEKLRGVNIKTVGALANTDEAVLKRLLGSAGSDIKKAARGISSDVVDPGNYEKIKSIGNSRTLERDLESLEELGRAIYDIAELVGSRIRKKSLAAWKVTVQLKDHEFRMHSHSRTYPEPVFLTADIYECARELLAEMWKQGTRIRLVGITMDDLVSSGSRQLELFNEENRERHEKLEVTVDRLREKYGDDSVLKGRSTMPGSLGIYSKKKRGK